MTTSYVWGYVYISLMLLAHYSMCLDIPVYSYIQTFISIIDLTLRPIDNLWNILDWSQRIHMFTLTPLTCILVKWGRTEVKRFSYSTELLTNLVLMNLIKLLPTFLSPIFKYDVRFDLPNLYPINQSLWLRFGIAPYKPHRWRLRNPNYGIYIRLRVRRSRQPRPQQQPYMDQLNTRTE